MYHIKQDKRVDQSAALICEGLALALQGKPYAEISITEVCRHSGIARTTFYRLFDTLDDVLLYQFDELFKTCLQAYAAQAEERSFAKTILDLATHNKALISAMIASGRSDLFSRSGRAQEDSILRSMDLEMSEKDRLYCTAILTQLAYAVLGTWVNTGCRESSAALYEIMRRDVTLLNAYL